MWRTTTTTRGRRTSFEPGRTNENRRTTFFGHVVLTASLSSSLYTTLHSCYNLCKNRPLAFSQTSEGDSYETLGCRTLVKLRVRRDAVAAAVAVVRPSFGGLEDRPDVLPRSGRAQTVPNST